MSAEMPERPTLGARRSPRPAPDKHVDPIEPVSALIEGAKQPKKKILVPQKVNRVPFSNRLSEKTLDTLARVKAETKLPIYEAIELAVSETWGEYERNK